VRGRDYVDQIEGRWRQLNPRETTLRAVN